MIKVLCVNTTCNHINLLPTGKKTNQAWDVNKKLALAAIHLGLGEHQINGLLSILNIPTVSHSMLDERIREVGMVIESVADESMEEWTEKEKEVNRESEGNEKLTVAVDAGWQKRGSGRSYDSLTGHCSMIGCKTGKVLNYKWRSKICRICQRAEREGKIARVHRCAKNFDGSAKAMEPDMVADMVSESREKGANITSIVGDEDTTTIARLRSKVDPSIVKLSDSNHIKKPIRNSLYELKKKHSSLSPKVINYIIKCFNYLIAQGKGQPQKIENSLTAIYKHPFGDHTSCTADWCRFVVEPNTKYYSLPYGKPLKDRSLQDSLKSLFDRYASNSEKLSNLGSTQANESFNKSVAAKAPKNRFYGGSRSLGYRIAATVAQKNKGHKYTVDVNLSSGLSPGEFTHKLATLRDNQAEKRKAFAITTAAKLRRIALKANRNKTTTTNEVREGVCYKSNINLEVSAENEIDEIPPPRVIQTEGDALDNMTRIFFDIEATGLSRTSHILQISAKREDDMFSNFILPECEVSTKATEITGLSFQNGSLLLNNNVVSAVKIKPGLNNLITFLEKSKNNIIFGHNIYNYDCPVLYNALEKCSLLEKFEHNIIGFVDTLRLFKLCFPRQDSYSQSSLCEKIGGFTFNAHNAEDDVNALYKLVNDKNICIPDMEKVYLSKFNVLDKYIALKELHKNLPTLKQLVDSKVITTRTANIIAKSGLSLHHLKLAHSRNGREGIKYIFTEKCGSSVRVTNSTKIIDKVAEFLQKM